jgi:hypothetical protein
MRIDLRTENWDNSWGRCFGDHEAQGFEVAVGGKSAQVTMESILFVCDRQDVPTAWSAQIEVSKLREELLSTIVRHMSTDLLGKLFDAVHAQYRRAYWDGEATAKAKIREALGV